MQPCVCKLLPAFFWSKFSMQFFFSLFEVFMLYITINLKFIIQNMSSVLVQFSVQRQVSSCCSPHNIMTITSSFLVIYITDIVKLTHMATIWYYEDNVIYCHMYHSTVESLILIDQKVLFKQLWQSCQLQDKSQV